MISFLQTFFKSEPGLSVHINFDKFLADTIHKQLVNFHSLRHFRYYTYLLKIFLETNKREFPEATFVSTECKRITLFIFINKVMSRVYSLIFNTNLPRVLDDMRSYLQPNPENKVGYWVLFMHSEIIWVYGCHESPYLLPILLTPRIFSLEFIRQRITSETQHFLKLHRASNLKFLFVIGPFIVKSRSCLSQVQAKLAEFGFAQLHGRRYDSHQIIFKRRQMNKSAPYEHEYVEGFDKLDNLEFCVDIETTLQPVQTQQMEVALQPIQNQLAPQKLMIKIPKESVYSKRSSSEAMDIKDQQTSPKKMKVTQLTQIVDLEEEESKDQANQIWWKMVLAL
jgi:hypothetical protein